MSRYLFPLFLFLSLGLPLVAGSEDPARPRSDAPAGDPKAGPHDPAALARRCWTLTELVLENHFDPPTRQEMFLAGIKGLLREAKTNPPAGLSRRVSGLASEKDFTTFLREVWPPAGSGQAPAPKLEAAMVDGLLHSVPGETRIIPALEQKVVQQISSNRYIGIGVQLAMDADAKLAKIVVPLRGGTAYKAGAKPGDLIVRINGASAHNLALAKVVELLRGEEGTSLTMVVRQPDATEERTLKMTREVVPFDTVVGYRRASPEGWDFRVDKDAPIAYALVRSINASTLHELRQVERRLKSEGARALVLDLRTGGGSGQLHHAALFADAFLDGGVLWRTRDARNQVREYRADRECLFRGWPLAVLVDESIFDRATLMAAAALQDNGRAVLVGDKTRGDGYINRLVNLPDGQGHLLLRSGVMERSGPKPRGWPVEPDHLVPMSKSQKQALTKWYQQKDLPELPANVTDTPPEDPQLAKAVEVLKAALKAQGKQKVQR